MARPSYLARRAGGRYFLQIRLGKRAAELFQLPLLRVSLRTSDFAEARRRLVDNLGWVLELIEAPDLEAIGTVFDVRLRAYVDRGSPADERLLAERCAFENEVRRYFTRAQERGYAYQKRFPEIPGRWVDFVDQNKAAESSITRLTARRSYEAGRREAREAFNEGWEPAPNKAPALRPETLDPIAMLDRLVQDAVGRRMAQLAPGNLAPVAAPTIVPAETGNPNEPAKSDGSTATTPDRMSILLQEFLRPAGRKRQHTMKGRGEAEAVVQFAIDFLGDPRIDELTEEKWKLLDDALPDIPNRDNIPREFSQTLFQRFKYAETHGWKDLVRVTTTTIQSRYWGGLYKFLDFVIEQKLYAGPRPKFVCIDPENLAPLPRDAFDDTELLQLLQQPLFTGCKNRLHVWQPGGYFVQSHIYWGFLICILTGMRPGEVGQLKCADIRTDGEFYYFDLRPFDARSGRVALKDLRNLKTNAAGRVIPIHPILIELGLLDRMQDLIDKKEERLFPEWEAYIRKDGTVRWSQPLSKSWQYVKKLLKLSRADLTLYSTRHLMADWLDNEAIAQRTRDRILGHANDVRGRYGRKGILDPEIAAKIEALEPAVIKQMRKMLLSAKNRADAGGLTVLKTY
ncbi:tyrosine-type recombinase/integrase [Bradyrhizobium xenonodulans]|uniref:Tyrosine-type recombinase/integrase n=1 Tax=Bradyrhizobium xenonodulans TaxID=2736875 RepID=A0ABY7MK21_9BRAD|nr:tyrosine-type recombinase/integrase [Bradyrhizobium xenonodulans]WBL77245.1 tyrosine-type recombinase/integrase [Bradyrhizobium xenonodulans]